MSSRVYRLWQPGNPKLRIFLPDFWIKVVEPELVRIPKNCVKFEVDIRMTKHDIREYLTKIYNLPVRDVRTMVKFGEITWDFPYDVEKRKALWKGKDKKYAYVFMKRGFEFSYPELFENCEEDQVFEKGRMKQEDITNSEYANRYRKGIGELLP